MVRSKGKSLSSVESFGSDTSDMELEGEEQSFPELFTTNQNNSDLAENNLEKNQKIKNFGENPSEIEKNDFLEGNYGFEGKLVDVFHPDKQMWLGGVIIEVDERLGRVKVHFLFLDNLDDLWYEEDSERLKPFGTKAFCGVFENLDLGRLRPGQKIDVNLNAASEKWKELEENWVAAKVSKVLQNNKFIIVSVKANGNNGDDELVKIPLDLRCIQVFGTKQKIYSQHRDHQVRENFFKKHPDYLKSLQSEMLNVQQIPKTQRQIELYNFAYKNNSFSTGFDYEESKSDTENMPPSFMMDRGTPSEQLYLTNEAANHDYNLESSYSDTFAAHNIKFDQFTAALLNLGLGIFKIQGDGNCLFRAISHQVYDSPDYHMEVRQYCVDYMEVHSEFFRPFVDSDTYSSFEGYLEHKRKNGVWGDDLEIKALSELYNRPAYIYIYDEKLGAKKLKTFHEVDDSLSNKSDSPSEIAPILLSYFDSMHYDSIISVDEVIENRRTVNQTIGKVEMAKIREAMIFLKASNSLPEGLSKDLWLKYMNPATSLNSVSNVNFGNDNSHIGSKYLKKNDEERNVANIIAEMGDRSMYPKLTESSEDSDLAAAISLSNENGGQS